MPAESTPGDDPGPARRIQGESASDRVGPLSVALILHVRARVVLQLHALNARIADDLGARVGRAGQQDAIELGTIHLVAERLARRVELFDMSFAHPPPDRVAGRPVEAGAIDRFEHADRREQFAGARRK